MLSPLFNFLWTVKVVYQIQEWWQYQSDTSTGSDQCTSVHLQWFQEKSVPPACCAKQGKGFCSSPGTVWKLLSAVFRCAAANWKYRKHTTEESAIFILNKTLSIFCLIEKKLHRKHFLKVTCRFYLFVTQEDKSVETNDGCMYELRTQTELQGCAHEFVRCW